MFISSLIACCIVHFRHNAISKKKCPKSAKKKINLMNQGFLFEVYHVQKLCLNVFILKVCQNYLLYTNNVQDNYTVIGKYLFGIRKRYYFLFSSMYVKGVPLH